MKIVCNVNSSAQLSSMQSSSSLEFTFKWKHSFSSTCRHPPILRVAERLQRLCQCSVVPITVAACSSNWYADSVNTASSQFKSLCQELPRLVDLILVLDGSFLVILQHGRCCLMCTCAMCYWLNRRVLGNIEANKRYTQPDTYIQTFPAMWDVVMINVGLAQARPNNNDFC